jgi:hypothetical protein
LIGDLTSVPQPIEVKLFTDDPKTLLATARRVADRIAKIRAWSMSGAASTRPATPLTWRSTK